MLNLKLELYILVPSVFYFLAYTADDDSWTPLHPANVSGSFSHREFAAALQHLKPGKAPGPDSICPELIIHAGASLKSWLRGFLSSCLHHLKIPKIWRRALVVAIPKPSKPVEDPKSYRPISLLCVPYKILERLSTPASNLLLTLCSHGNRRVFDAEDPPWIKSLCSRKALRMHSKRKRRPVQSLST